MTENLSAAYGVWILFCSTLSISEGYINFKQAFIEILLTYSIMLVSGVQQKDSEFLQFVLNKGIPRWISGKPGKMNSHSFVVTLNGIFLP